MKDEVRAEQAERYETFEGVGTGQSTSRNSSFILSRNAPSSFIRALRPTQWIKNLFVFAAAIFAKAIFDWHVAWRVAAGFAIFSAVSSATYLLNDVLDR